MSDYEWPADPEFRRVAAKIADAVMVAVAAGETVGCGFLTRCPLGCVDMTGNTRPIDAPAKKLGITQQQGAAFAWGFDGFGKPNRETLYFQLGRAYRRRFVEGAK
jgi:hypothetical protein